MGHNDGMAKGFVVGLLAGSAIGAILALLYAPKSGKELRADLRERADTLMDDAEGYVEAARTRATDIVSEAKRRSNDLISDAQKKANTLIDDADKVISGAKQKVGNIAEEGVKVKDAIRAGIGAFKDERNRS